MKRFFFCAGIVLVTTLTSGCGPKRVPPQMLERLPYESKIELLESENDLAVAVDKLDEAQSEIARARDQIRRAKERLNAAEKEVGAAEDAKSRDIAELAVAEAKSRVEYLRARQQLNVTEESLATQNLDCAVTRHELSKFNAARKAKVEGSEALDPSSFEGQVKRCEEQYAEQRVKAKEVSEQTESVKAEWEKNKAQLARKTFDARASPFVE